MPAALVIERNVLEWRCDPTSDARLPQAVGDDVEWVVLCSEGYTSSLAAAALLDLGLHRATDVVGGYHGARPGANRGVARSIVASAVSTTMPADLECLSRERRVQHAAVAVFSGVQPGGCSTSAQRVGDVGDVVVAVPVRHVDGHRHVGRHLQERHDRDPMRLRATRRSRAVRAASPVS